MDHELVKEIEYILRSTNDVDSQQKSLSKILVYLISMSTLDPSYNPLLKRLLLKAYEIMPSSHLPRQLSVKLNIPIQRKRSVSFTDSSFCALTKDSLLSAEGEEQKRREREILSIVNIEVNRKFIPIDKITPGLNNNTQDISIVASLLVNSDLCIEPNITKNITLPNITVEEMLNNPHIFRRFY